VLPELAKIFKYRCRHCWVARQFAAANIILLLNIFIAKIFVNERFSVGFFRIGAAKAFFSGSP